MTIVLLQALGVVLAGLLAGEELVVRYGVQPALRRLDDGSHIRARVALVRSLRVVVPIMMAPAVLAVVLSAVQSGADAGAAWRWAGVLGLVAFLLFSFLGTVPINMRVVDWRADDPPADWRVTIRRWERIDVLRSTSALVAFLCVVVATTFARW